MDLEGLVMRDSACDPDCEEFLTFLIWNRREDQERFASELLVALLG
jgi:hypothetical protein